MLPPRIGRDAGLELGAILVGEAAGLLLGEEVHRQRNLVVLIKLQQILFRVYPIIIGCSVSRLAQLVRFWLIQNLFSYER